MTYTIRRFLDCSCLLGLLLRLGSTTNPLVARPLASRFFLCTITQELHRRRRHYWQEFILAPIDLVSTRPAPPTVI
jgi:hypothetical protein